MSQDLQPILRWIEEQQSEMATLLIQWASINSGSSNLSGLEHMLKEIVSAFNPFKAEKSSISLPDAPAWDSFGNREIRSLGRALLIRNRRKAPLRILLGGHMDTVFASSSKFQSCRRISNDQLEGPGVADMKGGLIVMLYALKALEMSPLAENIGWDVLITPDEEIGSVGSTPLWKQFAWQNNLALLFEPSLPDGAFVSERKGSATYVLEAKGRKAHVGRDFSSGAHAIAALSEVMVQAHALNSDQCIINIGTMHGGDAANIVPDHAYCLINVRAKEYPIFVNVEKSLHRAAEEALKKYQVAIEVTNLYQRPPKPLDNGTKGLLDILRTCANELCIPFETRQTGGVCDGNLVAAEGLPTIDTLGVVGNGLHTDSESMEINSLTTRCQLTAALLIELAGQACQNNFLHTLPDVQENDS